MKACGTASIFGTGALLAANAFAACARPAPPDVPPVTVARPAEVDAAPAIGPSATTIMNEGIGEAGAPADASVPKTPPVKASFVDLPATVGPATCSRVIVSVAKGKAIVFGENLAQGDTLVVSFPDTLDIKGGGLAVVVTETLDCVSKPAMEKKVVRASAAPELKWAGGAMSAHLDVGTKVSPNVYLGRLEGTAAVPEHTHPGTWEILAAIEANGTFVLEGTEGRLGPRQIVVVPPGARHAWKPEPGSKLVAIQMYAPPGPEQRFVALAAADKDAGADAGKK